MRAEVREKPAAGAAVGRERGPVEGFRWMNNAGKVAYPGGPIFTKWSYFKRARTNSPTEPRALISTSASRSHGGLMSADTEPVG
ncbi:hypothetical protein [Actinoplanes utahensis]|uniref:8-oxoguanine DNA glycosylase OGG fold protein n=1 Tax=Actinoplanes utahensis TaxID=1869 RepID=UPI0035A22C0F